jgi:hypothetical protein
LEIGCCAKLENPRSRQLRRNAIFFMGENIVTTKLRIGKQGPQTACIIIGGLPTAAKGN